MLCKDNLSQCLIPLSIYTKDQLNYSLIRKKLIVIYLKDYKNMKEGELLLNQKKIIYYL